MRILDLILNLEIQEEKEYTISDLRKSQNIIVDGDIIQAKIDIKDGKRSNIANALNEYNVEYVFTLPRCIDNNFVVFLSANYKYLIVWDFSNNKDEVTVLDIQDIRSQDESYSTIQYGKILQYELGYWYECSWVSQAVKWWIDCQL